MEEGAKLGASCDGWGRTGFAGLVSVRRCHYFSRLSNDRLTEITRYWGHEHDYRNNLISVRWGGVVPREVPCNIKEAEGLRDGPFSHFRPSSNAFLEKGASGRSPLEGKEKNAVSKADVEVLEWQKAESKQPSVAAGSRADEPPVTSKSEDETEGEFTVNDTQSEADRNFGETKEEFEPMLEADDTAQSPRWESEILCVTDPFVRAKVKSVL
jgi:hypothetical protein